MTMQLNSGRQVVETTMRNLLKSGPVAEAGRYHLDNGGSRTRATLALDTAEALGLDQDVAVCCASAVELLHNASLVHDDLQEGDHTRRGQPAVWRKFGPSAAICLGDLMISAAFASLARHPRPAQALVLMHDATATTVHGQADDLGTQPRSMAAYRDLVMAKTGPLLALPVRLVLSAANAPGDNIATAFGQTLAVAYQAIDDLHDRDADRAAGRANLCTLFEASGYTPHRARLMAREEADHALRQVRSLATSLPRSVTLSLCNLADRLGSTLTEIFHAA